MPNTASVANGRPTTSESVELVSQRVSQLSDQVSTLARSFDGFAAKVDHRLTSTDDRIATQVSTLRSEMADAQVQAAKARIPQWQVIASVLASCVCTSIVVAGALWTAGIGPIKEANDKQTEILDRLSEKLALDKEKARDLFVARDDLDYRLNVSGKRRDEQFLDLSAKVAELEKRARDDSRLIVPRGEHERVWLATDAQIAANKEASAAAATGLQRQIDELKTALGGIYGARDVILDLRTRLDRIETARVRPPP